MKYFGSTSGLTTLAEDTNIPANGMVAYVTSSYNSGYQNGDIKLATLSDTDATNVTGSELVTNGTFDSDTSGWGSTNATLSVDSGYLKITSTGGNRPQANQDITTVVGKTYVITATARRGTCVEPVEIEISGISSALTGSTSNTTDTVVYSTFVATSTTHTLQVKIDDSNSASGETAFFDNVSVRLAEEDRSVNGNGLQVFGTVTKSAVATGADLVAYSGFSSSNYLQQPYNADLDFGTGDFCVMGWVKETANSATEVIFSRAYHTGSAWSGSYVQAYFNADGTITSRITDDGGSTKDTITSSSAYDTSTFNLLAIVRRGSSIEMWVNGAKAATDVTITQAAGSLNNASATFTLGSFQDQTSPLISGSLALFRISATAPSPSQILKIYNDEKVLFQEGAKAVLAGTSDAVTALAYDEDTQELLVGTNQNTSVFRGLRRVETISGSASAISASNGLRVIED